MPQRRGGMPFVRTRGSGDNGSCRKAKALDLYFASRACHQLLLYVAWKPDPMSQAVDFGIMHSVSNLNKAEAGSVNKPSRSAPSIDKESNIKSSGMENFKTELLTEGISTRTTDLIIEARRKGPRSNYNSTWGKWDRWCSE